MSAESPIKLLIVDDEEDLVEMLALRLRAARGFEVETANDGPSGLEKARAQRPDVILLDNVMPGMDGWEVCRRLRQDERTRGARIIMLTAGNVGRTEPKVLDAGADEIVLKPYDQDQLIGLLRQGKEGVHAQNR